MAVLVTSHIEYIRICGGHRAGALDRHGSSTLTADDVGRKDVQEMRIKWGW